MANFGGMSRFAAVKGNEKKQRENLGQLKAGGISISALYRRAVYQVWELCRGPVYRCEGK